MLNCHRFVIGLCPHVNQTFSEVYKWRISSLSLRGDWLDRGRRHFAGEYFQSESGSGTVCNLQENIVNQGRGQGVG